MIIDHTKKDNGYSNSRYWMGSVADQLDSGKNLIKLSVFQKAIANFVRITTGKDIPVEYSQGSQSFTDGKRVVLSSKIEDSLFDVNVGLALHEAAHIKLSDFKLLKKLVDGNLTTHNKIGKPLNTILSDASIFVNGLADRKRGRWAGNYAESLYCEIKDILNIIEDRRIDHYIYSNAPGYRGYYQELYAHYFNSPSIDKALSMRVKNQPTWSNYKFHLCNITNPNLQLNTLPKLKKIYNLINIENIGRLKNTTEALLLSLAVINELKDELFNELYVPKPENTSSAGSGGDCDTNDNKKQSNAGDEDSMNSNPEEDSTPDMSDNQTDESSADQNSNTEPNESESSNEFTKEEFDKLNEAIDKQERFVSGEHKKAAVSSEEKTQLDTIRTMNLDLVDVNKSSNAIPEDFMNISNGFKTGPVKCIVVNELTDDIITYSSINPIVKEMLFPKSQVNKVKSTISGGGELYASRYSTSYASVYSSIEEGIKIGKILGKKLKVRNESNELSTTRLRHGRIDKRLIAEIGYGAEAVFSKLQTKTVTPVTIHYSIDASGSMSGNRFNSAVRVGAAIAKAASMISGVDVTISFRGTCYMAGMQYPVMMIGYDSRKNGINHLLNVMSYVQPSGSTPEGLCFESILNHMQKNINGNKDGIFINISDGAPGFSSNNYADKTTCNYNGTYAELHTKKQVDKIKSMGYKVLSYFVDGRYNGNICFDNMYGKSARYINTEDVNQLAYTLNDIMLQPVVR